MMATPITPIILDRPGLIQYLRRINAVFFQRIGNFTPVVNRVQLNPVQIPVQLTLDRIAVIWAVAGTGNIRVGLYRDVGDTPLGGELIVDSGAVAKALVTGAQEVTIVDTILMPGLYWIAFQASIADGTSRREINPDTTRGTLQAYYYNPVGFAFTDPCPALTVETDPIVNYVRVKSIP